MHRTPHRKWVKFTAFIVIYSLLGAFAQSWFSRNSWAQIRAQTDLKALLRPATSIIPFRPVTLSVVPFVLSEISDFPMEA